MSAATAKPESKILYREAAIDPAAVKADSREIDLSFSSESPVERYDWSTGKTYMEILDHSDPKSADLSRLNDGGAFLREHKRDQQVGVVMPGTCKIGDDKKGRCRGKLSRSPVGEQELQDIRDGIRTKISFGYETGGLIRSEVKDGVEWRWYRWTAFEVSTVSIPADTAVGVGRSEPRPVDTSTRPNVEDYLKTASPEEKARMKLLLDPAPAPTTETAGAGKITEVDQGKVRADARDAERTRISEIRKVGDELTKDHGNRNDGKMAEEIRGMVTEAINDDESVKDFKMRCMEKVLGAKPAKPATMSSIGMNKREEGEYSIMRGIQSCLRRGKMEPDGLEGEVHQQMVKDCTNVAFEGFAIPMDAPMRCRPTRRERAMMLRDSQAGVFGQGGALVPTILQGPVIELLRNKLVVERLGIQVLSGLTGNIAIPRQTGAATAFSVPEMGALTKSTQTLDQIPLTPHRVGAWNEYSKQLLLQSSIDVENFLRDDLFKVIATKWDFLVLQGQGAGSEPTGIINTVGVGSVTFGATATWAKILAFETALAVANADAGNIAFVTTPAVRAAWKNIAKIGTTFPNFLWENGSGDGDGSVNSYRAAVTNQVNNNLVFFGNWEEEIMGLYGGYDLLVNPYARDTEAAVRITVNTFGDCVARHAQSFVVSSDNGNQ